MFNQEGFNETSFNQPSNLGKIIVAVTYVKPVISRVGKSITKLVVNFVAPIVSLTEVTKFKVVFGMSYLKPIVSQSYRVFSLNRYTITYSKPIKSLSLKSIVKVAVTYTKPIVSLVSRIISFSKSVVTYISRITQSGFVRVNLWREPILSGVIKKYDALRGRLRR